MAINFDKIRENLSKRKTTPSFTNVGQEPFSSINFDLIQSNIQKKKSALEASLAIGGDFLKLTSPAIPLKEKEPFEKKPVFEGVGTAFRTGILQASSALESTAGLVTKKIGETEIGMKFDIDLISKELEKASDLDRELSKVGLRVADNRVFLEKIRDPNFITTGLAQNIPNLLVSMGISVPVGFAIAGAGVPVGIAATIGGGLAFLTAGALEGGFAFQEAKEFGADEEIAEKVAVITGVANGLLEAVPPIKLLSRTPVGKEIKKKIVSEMVKRILGQAATEAITESLQEVVSNSVAKVAFDEQRNILEGTPESAFFGALLGSGASVVTDVITNPEVKARVQEALKNEQGFAKVPFIKEEKPTAIPKELEPLVKEARKFKTSEEFIKSVFKSDKLTELVTRPSKLRFELVKPENIIKEQVKLPFGTEGFLRKNGQLIEVVEKKTGRVMGKSGTTLAVEDSAIKKAIADAKNNMEAVGESGVLKGIKDSIKAPDDFSVNINRISDEKINRHL